MTSFLVRKLGYGLLVLAGVIIIIFFLFNVLPVNSARMTLGQRADVSSIEAIEKELGLNLPVHLRLLKYVNDLSPLSVYENSPENKDKYKFTVLLPISDQAIVWKAPYLGRSYQTRRPVAEILAEKIPPTAILAFTSMLLAAIIGITFGIIAALFHNRWPDNLVVVSSVIGISQPSYFSGIILALIFGFLLHDYTGLNHSGALFDLSLLGDEIIVWKNLILPAIALGIRPIAIIMQLTRSEMIDVLSQDYIRTARAKGLKERIVLVKHALRNALNPVVTSISGWLAALLSGSFFVEVIFDFKGLGYESVKALLNFDFPVVMGTVLFFSLVFITVNMLVDILYGLLDPRISVS